MEIVKLDVKDKKILLALDMDARQAESRIAKSVGLSKQLMGFRIRRLEKNRIIRSYHAVIDHTKLGLKLYRVGLKLKSTEKEQDILAHLKKRASWIASVLGRFDLSFAVYAKDEYEFMEFWKGFYDKHSQYVEDRWITLMTRFWNLERTFICPVNRRKLRLVIGENPEVMHLDGADLDILRALAEDARDTSVQIGEKLKLTERIVRYRVQRMETSKVILGYRAFIDMSRLGYKFYKVYINLQNITPGLYEKIREHISQMPEVGYMTEALGGYDFELKCYFPDSHALHAFLQGLKKEYPENIKEIEFIEYIKEHKVSYYPSENY